MFGRLLDDKRSNRIAKGRGSGMMKKYIVNEDNERPVCVNCQSEILDEEYLMLQENFLLVNYFDDPDGLDNIFCSEHCICESLFVAGVEILEE